MAWRTGQAWFSSMLPECSFSSCSRQHGGVQAAQQSRGDASDPNEGEEGLSSSAGTCAHWADAQAPPPAGPGGGTSPSKAGPSDLLTGRFLIL